LIVLLESMVVGYTLRRMSSSSPIENNFCF
jgi:hypothetical protein